MIISACSPYLLNLSPLLIYPLYFRNFAYGIRWKKWQGYCFAEIKNIHSPNMTLIPPIWRESTNSVDCYCGGSTNPCLSVGRDDNDDSPVLQYSSVHVKPMEENAVTLIQLVRWPFWAPDEISERLGTVPLYWGGVIAGRRCPTGLNWVIIISSKCCCDLFRNLVLYKKLLLAVGSIGIWFVLLNWYVRNFDGLYYIKGVNWIKLLRRVLLISIYFLSDNFQCLGFLLVGYWEISIICKASFWDVINCSFVSLRWLNLCDIWQSYYC